MQAALHPTLSDGRLLHEGIFPLRMLGYESSKGIMIGKLITSGKLLKPYQSELQFNLIVIHQIYKRETYRMCKYQQQEKHDIRMTQPLLY
jgi:hypothetical protein